MQERRPDEALTNDDDVRRAWLGAGTIATVVIVADQVTKTLAEEHLRDEAVHVIGTLRLTLAYNRGIAFGIADGVAPFLVAAAVLGALLLLLKNHRAVRGAAIVGIGLVMGGALGNLVDRIFRGHGGAVVDFIDLQWWPVFNLADAAVVTGALVLVLWGSRRPADDTAT